MKILAIKLFLVIVRIALPNSSKVSKSICKVATVKEHIMRLDKKPNQNSFELLMNLKNSNRLEQNQILSFKTNVIWIGLNRFLSTFMNESDFKS